MIDTSNLLEMDRAKKVAGTRVRLIWNLATVGDFTGLIGMRGTVRWGASGWGVEFDDDPGVIHLDVETFGGSLHPAINLCVLDYSDDENAAPSDAPAPTAPISLTVPGPMECSMAVNGHTLLITIEVPNLPQELLDVLEGLKAGASLTLTLPPARVTPVEDVA